MHMMKAGNMIRIKSTEARKFCRVIKANKPPKLSRAVRRG